MLGQKNKPRVGNYDISAKAGIQISFYEIFQYKYAFSFQHRALKKEMIRERFFKKQKHLDSRFRGNDVVWVNFPWQLCAFAGVT
jgi:hypothetical protein